MSRTFLIVGQGVAGSALAFLLHQRGHHVRIVDDGHRTSATKIAAGMVNPITGKRLAKTPDWENKWPVALDFYRQLEALSGQRIFHPLPIVRCYRNAEERARMAKRFDDPAYQPYLGPAYEPRSQEGCDDAFGSVSILQGGRVDTTALLAAARQHFAAE